MVMLGALVGVSGLVSREALIEVVASRSGRFREVNLRGVKLGFRLGEGR